MKGLYLIIFFCIGYIFCFFSLELPYKIPEKKTKIRFEYGCSPNLIFCDTILEEHLKRYEKLLFERDLFTHKNGDLGTLESFLITERDDICEVEVANHYPIEVIVDTHITIWGIILIIVAGLLTIGVAGLLAECWRDFWCNFF